MPSDVRAHKGDNSGIGVPTGAPTPVKFDVPNAQSDGVNNLKRMEFEFMGKFYKFALNPEEYTQTEPARVSITQTKAGAWVDDFGAGLPVISIKGTTGFRTTGGIATSLNGVIRSKQTIGFERFKQLRDLIRQYYGTGSPGESIAGRELVFHNYTDGEDWVVIPETFNLMRSVARPLLYLYEIKLTCIRPASHPAPHSDSLSGAVGKIGKLGKIDVGGS